MSNLLQKGAVFEFLAPIVAEKSVSKSTGLHAIFRKIAILFDLSKIVPLLSFTPYSLLFTLRLFTYPDNLRNFFQRADFSIFKSGQYFYCFDIIEGTVVEKSHKDSNLQWACKIKLSKE